MTLWIRGTVEEIQWICVMCAKLMIALSTIKATLGNFTWQPKRGAKEMWQFHLLCLFTNSYGDLINLGEEKHSKTGYTMPNDCLQKSRFRPSANVLLLLLFFYAGVWKLYKGVCQGALGHRWRKRMLPQHWLEQQQIFVRLAMSSGQPHKLRLQLTHLLATTGSHHAAGRNGGENVGWRQASHQRQWIAMPSFAYIKGYY